MALLERLSQHTDLTDNEIRIRDYLTSHLADIPGITVEQLAALTYTSHSAIVRLAKKLDYQGFRELKLAASDSLTQQLISLGAVDANFPFNPTDSVTTIAKNMADLTSTAIKRAQAQVNPHQLETAAQMLLDAKRLFFFGRGDSQIRARSFQNKLVKLDIFPILAEEYVDEKWVTTNIHETDCVLFISYGANIPEYAQIMTFLKKNHVPTILLTGNRQIKQTNEAQLTIVSAQDENEDESKIGMFSSQIAFEYVLDTLFSIMYGHAYTRNLLSQRQTATMLNTGSLFEKDQTK